MVSSETEDIDKTQCGLKFFGGKFKVRHEICGKILPKAYGTNDCSHEDIIFPQKVIPQGGKIFACSAVWQSLPVVYATCEQ